MDDVLIEEEFERFVKMIAEKTYDPEISMVFLDENELEGEFCHDDIEKMHYALLKRIKTWLHENRPSEFAAYADWCVHVFTADFIKTWKFPKRREDIMIVK